METESKGESRGPATQMENVLFRYRHLVQEHHWTDALRDTLQDVWLDFRSFKLVDVGRYAKALQYIFDPPAAKTTVFRVSA